MVCLLLWMKDALTYFGCEMHITNSSIRNLLFLEKTIFRSQNHFGVVYLCLQSSVMYTGIFKWLYWLKICSLSIIHLILTILSSSLNAPYTRFRYYAFLFTWTNFVQLVIKPKHHPSTRAPEPGTRRLPPAHRRWTVLTTLLRMI